MPWNDKLKKLMGFVVGSSSHCGGCGQPLTGWRTADGQIRHYHSKQCRRAGRGGRKNHRRYVAAERRAA